MRGARSHRGGRLTFGLTAGLLLVPVVGESLALGWLGYRLLPRWPVWVLAVLTLPLDPWLAEPLAWPLRRMTALLVARAVTTQKLLHRCVRIVYTV